MVWLCNLLQWCRHVLQVVSVHHDISAGCVRDATKHTADHTQPHPSVTLHVILKQSHTALQPGDVTLLSIVSIKIFYLKVHFATLSQNVQYLSTGSQWSPLQCMHLAFSLSILQSSSTYPDSSTHRSNMSIFLATKTSERSSLILPYSVAHIFIINPFR